MRKKRYAEMSKYFRLALIVYSANQPRGFQKEISNVLEVEKTYMSDFFTGKRLISEELRDDLAKYIGFNYEDLLSLGKKMSEDSVMLGSEFKSEIYSKNFAENIRKKKNLKISDLMVLLNMSEPEYIFKERNFLAFTHKELRKIELFSFVPEEEREEYLSWIWLTMLEKYEDAPDAEDETKQVEHKPDKTKRIEYKVNDDGVIDVLHYEALGGDLGANLLIREHEGIMKKFEDIFRMLTGKYQKKEEDIK